ncbi:MAG: DegT/DnrJ/EryC1/StrS family aminotransferase [Clostridia bacterium]|nr:DegT/DnrJ/EryC1/StrS family aminotransferase [Clostridia bacterium]
MSNIQVTRSSMPDFEEYCAEIKKLWDSHWLTNMGVEHIEFQRQLEEYLACPHVTLYTNGHLALENVIAALQLPRGSEVITTPFTFASTTHAIVRNGLVPVFCDIRPDDYTMDADQVEALITDKTAAIAPVHVYGNICQVEKLKGIARRHGLKLIYDAAHAFGVKYKGISAANFGDASMFSFHATKVFNTIEGGAVCYQDDNLVQVLNDMKNFGIRNAESVAYAGGNAKMSEFQAAMGICNLRHLKDEISKRKRVAERYMQNLSGTRGVKLCPPSPDTQSNYAYFPIVFEDSFGASRDQVFEALGAIGVTARKYFYPLTNSFECYRDLPTAGIDKTPRANYVAQRVLTLPLYADLALEDVDRICETVLRCKR